MGSALSPNGLSFRTEGGVEGRSRTRGKPCVQRIMERGIERSLLRGCDERIFYTVPRPVGWVAVYLMACNGWESGMSASGGG